MSGIRDNLGFEAMTLSHDGSRVAAVSENALVQDGPAASLDGPSPSRLVVLDRATGADVGEYVYRWTRSRPAAWRRPPESPRSSRPATTPT